MRHESSDSIVENVKILRKGWAKFRALAWFKRCVKGGVCAVEISTPDDENSGFDLLGNHGAHPHIHALLDCRWLLVSGSMPQGPTTSPQFKRRVREIQSEIAVQWRLCLNGIEGGIFTRRAKKDSVHEVLKYAISSNSLINSKIPVAPIIDALSGRKAVMPFGSIRKALKIVRAEKKAAQPPLICECGAEEWGLDPNSPKETFTIKGRWLQKNGQYARFIPWNEA